jgi:hypothetical protein
LGGNYFLSPEAKALDSPLCGRFFGRWGHRNVELKYDEDSIKARKKHSISYPTSAQVQISFFRSMPNFLIRFQIVMRLTPRIRAASD